MFGCWSLSGTMHAPFHASMLRPALWAGPMQWVLVCRLELCTSYNSSCHQHLRHPSSSSSAALISEHSRLHKLTPLWTILRTHPRCVKTNVMRSKVELYCTEPCPPWSTCPASPIPLEDDWWLLEECASGLVMSFLAPIKSRMETFVVSAYPGSPGKWP